MLIFEVGKKIPVDTPAPGVECGKAVLSRSNFDIYYWIDWRINKLVEMWKSAPIRYAVYVKNSVPFFLMDFIDKEEAWTFDVSINILKYNFEVTNNWFAKKGNAVNLFLCDQSDNTLLAMRMIGLHLDSTKLVKDACERQIKVYADSEDVDKYIGQAYKRYSISEMANFSQTGWKRIG